jgi:hypothetical protein
MENSLKEDQLVSADRAAGADSGCRITGEAKVPKMGQHQQERDSTPFIV